MRPRLLRSPSVRRL